MATNTQADLHFELERIISRRVDSKLIPYQVSISDSFYEKYTKLWKKTLSVDFVIEHRPFYAQLTKNCIYDTLDKVDRKSLSKHLAELEALVDISETKEDFYMYFEKKYTKTLPDFSDYMNQKKNKLSEFDKKLWVALHFNPKESKKGDRQ